MYVQAAYVAHNLPGDLLIKNKNTVFKCTDLVFSNIANLLIKIMQSYLYMYVQKRHILGMFYHLNTPLNYLNFQELFKVSQGAGWLIFFQTYPRVIKPLRNLTLLLVARGAPYMTQISYIYWK